jgi:hypothetical protein
MESKTGFISVKVLGAYISRDWNCPSFRYLFSVAFLPVMRMVSDSGSKSKVYPIKINPEMSLPPP